MLNPLLGAPLAFLYWIGVMIRNWLFDAKIRTSREYDIPLICVGNLTVGGTGKTPLTEYLVEHFMPKYRVAVLSRGYKRRRRGFVLATVTSSYLNVGDEPKQIKLKYPDVPVAVCRDRNEGIRRLREAHPETDLIILDDAFQHRQVEPWVNIVLMDYNRPVYHDHLLPWGRLRDHRSQLPRAHFVLATKCPPHMTPLDMRLMRKSLRLFPYQTLYFTRMQQERALPLFPDEAPHPPLTGDPVLIMAGIAHPQSFLRSLSSRFRVVGELFFPDHHAYRTKDMARLQTLLKSAPENTRIVTTEKDAVKLTNARKIPAEIRRRLFYIPIHVTFEGNSEENFLRQLEPYVLKNQKYSVLHPQ